MTKIVIDDPAVDTVGSFIGGGSGSSTVNNGRLFITLKPLSAKKGQRGCRSSTGCATRLAGVDGITLYLQASQDIRVGGRLGTGAISIRPAARRLGRAQPLVRAAGGQAAQNPPAQGCQQRPANPRTAGQCRRSTATPPPGSASPRPRLTTRSTTLSASGRSPPFMSSYNQHHVVLEVDPALSDGPRRRSRKSTSTPPTARRCRSSQRCQFSSTSNTYLVRQPPGPVSRRHPLLQSRARRVAGRGHGTRSARRRRR